MGSKYYALFARYPFNGGWDYSISEQKLFKFLIKFIKVQIKYHFEIVDVQFRDSKRMDKINANSVMLNAWIKSML